MCGIVGIRDPRGVPSDVLQAMTRELVHRGPDDEGFLYLDKAKGEYVDAPSAHATLGFGFRRLSIVDLGATGHQPMLTPDRGAAIIFNGEIYNYLELRAELEARGVHFRGRSDSEVILHLLALEGLAALPRLNGMFALAFHDRRTGTLILARDHVGIKPLYWLREGPAIVWASEPKAFLHYPSFRPDVNRERLHEFFLFRHVIGPDTLLRGVHSVEPGGYVLIRDGEAREVRWYKPPPHEPEPLTEDEAAARVDAAVGESVKAQLMSDVKVGCQLSGGIDSTLISWWAARHHGSLFDSFSVSFDDPRYDESPFIDAVVAKLGLVGHTTRLATDEMAASLLDAAWHHDFPISHPNALGIYALAREARRHHVTVLLSGEGADEVFGGYAHYNRAAWLARLNALPGGLELARCRGLARAGDLARALVLLSAIYDPKVVREACPWFDGEQALRERLELWAATPETDALEHLMAYERRAYMEELLHRQDRMSMTHSIENRVPYLDPRVLALARRLPTRLKVAVGLFPRRGTAPRATKPILKRLVANRFGDNFAYRAKSGFALPLRAIFVAPAFEATWPAIRDAVVALSVAEAPALDALKEQALREGGDAAKLLWTFTALGAWWRGISRVGAVLRT
ncbi:MAG: asparagine synthase (glutamine-hydrolyzing) [Candidatus Sungbacteria bacterium]|nr:asparagine synthase (glutamine-hydrolyzing) [Candidatus Sungbacteria bacterium]